MKYLIVPDIHNNTRVEKLISLAFYTNKLSSQNCKIIFLGDYFDSFGDTDELNKNTAKWLRKSLLSKERIHLIGNHDLNYIYSNNNSTSKCPGYDILKCIAINEIINTENWNKLKFYHIEVIAGKIWLFTHAGLNRRYYSEQSILKLDEFLSAQSEEAKNILLKYTNNQHWFWNNDGIVWCRPDRFVLTDNLQQVFGHTYNEQVLRLDSPERNSINICCDTLLRNLLLINEDGGIEILNYST